jgi:hypothetical protein
LAAPTAKAAMTAAMDAWYDCRESNANDSHIERFAYRMT